MKGWGEQGEQEEAGRAAGIRRRQILFAEAGAGLEIPSAGAEAGQRSSAEAAESLAEGIRAVGAAGQGIRSLEIAGTLDADRESLLAAAPVVAD